MAEITTFRCDECGKLKQEANHWYRGVSLDGPQRFTLFAWNCIPYPPGELLRPARELHFCGMGCAVKAITKAMEQIV